MKKQTIYQLVLAGLLTAFGIMLPSVFHMFGISGSIFLPMHIPVLLCGLLCGYRLGGLCGLLVPLLSSILTPMPPLYPVAIYMMFELAAYAIIGGLLIKKTNVFVALIAAMIGGRIVLGIAQPILVGIAGNPFSFTAFLTGAFVTALPGIIIQLVLVPLILFAAERLSKQVKVA